MNIRDNSRKLAIIRDIQNYEELSNCRKSN